MSRNIISICFSIIFLVFLTAPTIITIVDDSIDVSIFFSFSEEEEKGGEKSKDKEKEVLFFEFNVGEIDFVSNEAKNNLEYYFKNYPKPHLNLILPPPESYIL